MTATTTTSRPHLSGFCGYSGLHERCPVTLGTRARPASCACTCHQPADPAPEPPLSPCRPEGLDEALRAVQSAVRGLDQVLSPWLDQALDVELLDALLEVRTSRVALAQFEAVLEGKAAAAMHGDVVEWPRGRAERRGGAKRTAWDDARVVGRLAQHAAEQLGEQVDQVTGELAADPAVTAAVAREAVALAFTAARPSWRVTALRGMGVQYDDACTTEWGRRTVQLLPVEDAS